MVRTMRKKHYDKMKLQRLKPYIKFFQYHSHISGKISNHSCKVGAVQISYPLEQYSPQLLLACSVTLSGKQHSPSSSAPFREQKKWDHRSYTSCRDITHLPNRAVLHTQNSFFLIHPSEWILPKMQHKHGFLLKSGYCCTRQSPEALCSNLLILWYGAMVVVGTPFQIP